MRKQQTVYTVAGMLAMILVVVVVISSSDSEPGYYQPIKWSVYKVQELTAEQMIKYIEWGNSSSCRQRRHFGGVLVKEGVDGQKAVCMDPLVKPERGECLVYSFNTNDDLSFDEAIAKTGCEVFTFNPSVTLNDHQNGTNIHFYNFGIKDPNSKNLETKSLEVIYNQLLHHQERIIDYLKLNIVNSKWSILPEMISSGMMDRVRQLGLEIHLPRGEGLEGLRRRVSIIKSLEDYGLVRFYSKYNLASLRKNNMVDWEGFHVYEIAWYNSNIHKTHFD